MAPALEANSVVFNHFYCKRGIHKLKIMEEGKTLLVGESYRRIKEI